jgi:gliding-associated putative ABC transporter substrate-binding component GldG
MAGGNNFVKRPWLYNPVLNNYNTDHPVSKNIDAVEGKFVSTIDTLSVPDIQKTILLSTSSQSRSLKTPARINYNIVNEKFAPRDDQFNKPNMPVAVLLEGNFSSAFKSLAPTAKQLHDAGYGYRDTVFIQKGAAAKQIMIGDGDLIKNYVDKTGRPDMLGRNYIEQYDFANREFFMSCVEYLTDQSGLIETHGKEVKLRLLDEQKIENERTKWQMINIIAPLVLLYLFSGIYLFIRNRKYAS